MSFHPAVDLIVAADVLVYFGDLAALLAAFASLISPAGGSLIFSCERADAASAPQVCADPPLPLHSPVPPWPPFATPFVAAAADASSWLAAVPTDRCAGGVPVPHRDGA